jgi:hypothetical protein
MNMAGVGAGVRWFDVCNRDAGGLSAVVQWRLQWPEEATLVTGLKRQVELLEQVLAGPRAAGIDRLPAAELDRFIEAFASEPWASH